MTTWQIVVELYVNNFLVKWQLRKYDIRQGYGRWVDIDVIYAGQATEVDGQLWILYFYFVMIIAKRYPMIHLYNLLICCVNW